MSWVGCRRYGIGITSYTSPSSLASFAAGSQRMLTIYQAQDDQAFIDSLAAAHWHRRSAGSASAACGNTMMLRK